MCDKTSFILEFFLRNLDKVINWLSKDKVLCCPDKDFLWNLCEFISLDSLSLKSVGLELENII